MGASAIRVVERIRDQSDFVGALTSGYFLEFDGTNFTLSPVVSGVAIGDPIGGGTVGSVLFVGTGPVLAQDNANFFWNDADDSLILAATPPASATKAGLRLGAALSGGNAAGTFLGINAPVGYVGDFFHAQRNNQTRYLFGHGGNGYGDKIVQWNSTDNASLLTVTGDGRVFVGADTGADVVLTVNMSGKKSSGVPFAIQNGGNTVLFAATGFSTDAANFNFGANSQGNALTMVAPINSALVVYGARVGINNLGSGQPDGQLSVKTEDTTTNGIFVKMFANHVADPLRLVNSADVILMNVDLMGAGMFRAREAGTGTVLPVLTLGHNSTGTPVAGFGASIRFILESSTTEDRDAASIQTLWATATDASRKGRVLHTVWDTAERECIRLEASGSAPMLGFFGAPAVLQQTLAAAATDAATTQALANSLRTAIINLGLGV